MQKQFSTKKSKALGELINKKENTLDYYVSKNTFGFKDVNWWSRKELEKDELVEEEEIKKQKFLTKNVKPAEIIPSEIEKKQNMPDNLGYFETDFGTISVGYKKFKKNSEIGFSLVPDEVKVKDNIPERKLESKKTYFGGESKGRKKQFRASKISFKFNPRIDRLEKLEDDNDGIVDEEDKLLYQDKREKEQIEELQEVKIKKNSEVDRQIDKEIAITKDIKKQKEEDNLKFLAELRTFIERMKKGEIQKIVESDEAIIRKKRIEELSSMPDLNLLDAATLKKLLERILRKEENKGLLKEFLKIAPDKLNGKQLKETLSKILAKLAE